MANSRIRSCFITAPAEARLDVLTDVLKQRNIRVIGPDLTNPLIFARLEKA